MDLNANDEEVVDVSAVPPSATWSYSEAVAIAPMQASLLYILRIIVSLIVIVVVMIITITKVTTITIVVTIVKVTKRGFCTA